jgi:hypothetical protein
MTLKKLLRRLSVADLKNLSISDLSKQENREALILFINQGLQEIYKRFQIRTDTYTLALNGYDTVYTLPENCITILGVYELDGRKISLNDENDNRSVFTVDYNKIEVPETYPNTGVLIVYKAGPNEVKLDDDKIPLPVYAMKPLLDYVSYEAYKTIDGSDRLETESHHQRFLRSIASISNLGLEADDNTRTDVFESKGFI